MLEIDVRSFHNLRVGFGSPNKTLVYIMWIKWIRSCLESSTIFILVNGSPTEQFHPSKGLRQGDPQAPFLFLILAEGLAGVMRVAQEKGLYDRVKVGKDQVDVSML